MLTKTMTSFEGKNMECFGKLRYRINLYLHDYKLSVEIDKDDDDHRDIEYELKI